MIEQLQRETAGTPPGALLAAVAATLCGDLFNPHLRWLADLGVHCVVTGDVAGAIARDGCPLALVPAFTDMHSQRLARLADDHPALAIVGVVSDLSGHYTHRAIQHGACSVLNLLLPEHTRVSVLRAAVNLCPASAIAPPAGGPPAARVFDPRDQKLLTLLRGSATIAEIADQLYCSQRSLYRRLRPLYAALGVTSRQELRAVMSRRWAIPPPVVLDSPE